METNLIKNNCIISVCKNYDKIVNYIYDDNDYLTHILIDYYRNFIATITLDNMDEVNIIYDYDIALNYYLNEFKFYKLVQNKYSNQNNWGNSIINNLINLYDIYKEMNINFKKIDKWI